MSTARRLERAFARAPVLPLNRCSRYVLISDCHRGPGIGVQDHSLEKGGVLFTDNVMITVDKVKPASFFKPGEHTVNILVDLGSWILPVPPRITR